MKIIGIAQHGGYIAEISHTELEKVANKYYGKLPDLKVGSEMDLGAGYNFCREIQSACKEMEDAVKQFHQAQSTMMKFAVMVGRLPTEPEPQP